VDLMAKFYEFYDALLIVDAGLSAGNAAADGQRILVQLLERQTREVRAENGSHGVEVYSKAKYAMAALGDEILLSHDLAYAERWSPRLLESTLFRSQRAGEEIFEEIDKLSDVDAAAGELARVYLAVLALGFQGNAKSTDAEMSRRRRRLFALAYGDPTLIGSHPLIAPAAYESTLADGERSELPHLRPWIYALILLVVLYVAAGAAMWHATASELDPLVEQVIARHPGSAP